MPAAATKLKLCPTEYTDKNGDTKQYVQNYQTFYLRGLKWFYRVETDFEVFCGKRFIKKYLKLLPPAESKKTLNTTVNLPNMDGCYTMILHKPNSTKEEMCVDFLHPWKPSNPDQEYFFWEEKVDEDRIHFSNQWVHEKDERFRRRIEYLGHEDGRPISPFVIQYILDRVGTPNYIECANFENLPVFPQRTKEAGPSTIQSPIRKLAVKMENVSEKKEAEDNEEVTDGNKQPSKENPVREFEAEDKIPYCDVCDLELENLPALHRHTTTYHIPVQCEYCQKEFPSRRNLKLHIPIHTGETFPCKKCDEVFLCDDDLKKHQAIHAKKKGLECEECGKLYAFEGRLRNHMRDVHDK